MMWSLLALAVLLVSIGALMAAVDAAISSLSSQDLEQLASSSRVAGSIRAIADDPNTHVNAVNFVRISAETIAAAVVAIAFTTVTPTLGGALVWAALTMAAVSFVLVGFSPRAVGRSRAEQLVRWSAPLVHLIRRILGPLAAVLVRLGNRVTPGRGRVGVSSERELLSVVDQATASDVLEEDDRQLIRSVLEFDDTVVRSVMVPRTDMVTVGSAASLEEALAEFLRAGVSRMPVVGDDIDEIDSVVYLRDVARRQFEGDMDVTAGVLARPAVLVPESMKLDALLRQMQLKRTHIALVVDEYGGIAGLVSMEDLIEELVGDISDEHDRGAAEVIDLGSMRYRVSARVSVEEIGELYGLELDDDDVDTVGGLLTKSLGRLPVSGDTVVIHGVVLRAGEVIGRRRLVNVVVEPDAALRDALEAFTNSEDTE